ncbi:MAG: extracellular solute-binding protein [Herbinix sp.]|nr:extracellular solute-binding protein [Herbinix sp.]
MKLRKQILTTLLAIAMIANLTGCSSTSPEVSTDTASVTEGSATVTTGASTNSASTGEKVKISFMSRDSGDTPIAKVYEEQIAAFMEENPNIEVQNDSIYEEAAYNNKLKVAISTGETPSIFYYPAIAGLKEWAKNGVIMDLTDALASDPEWADSFLDGALDTYKLDAYGVNGIYALPNEINVDVVFYNKALFKQAGITKTPDTMDELYEDIDKLNTVGITPFGVGGTNTWIMGHIFNNILAKRIAAEGITELGTGNKKWTDTDVVECLRLTKNLKEKGAFADGFEGMDYNTQMNQFLTGEVCMISHSSPIISEMFNSDSQILDDIGLFPFPSFEDKSEYKDTRVIYTSGWMLSGTMSEAEKDATLKLVKYMTTPESIQARMDAAWRVSPYKNINAAANAPQLLKDMIAYTNTITKSVGEYFDYDTCSTLVDTSRNGILNMMLGESPEDTAAAIQADIDENRP